MSHTAIREFLSGGEVHPGDVVWLEPNEKLWHGATKTNGITHIAIQENLNGKVLDWMKR